MTRTMAANQALTMARRAWQHVAKAARHLGELEPMSGLVHDELPVSALCNCMLGEGDGEAVSEGSNGAWPPRSVVELIANGMRGLDAADRGAPAHSLSSLLQEGLAALDEAAWHLIRKRFAAADRASQLRAIYRLESGRAGLSRRHAAAFLDTFLALAAEAYLRDALEPTARPGAPSLG